MLKYGSHVINGTAGGLNAFVSEEEAAIVPPAIQIIIPIIMIAV